MNNPLLINFPDHFSTARLLLRAVRPGDGQMLYESIAASRNELRTWLRFAVEEPTVEKFEQFARESAIKWLARDYLTFMIFEQSRQQFIGTCSLHHIDWAAPAFEIGYWQDTRTSGQGYMTEAIYGLMRFAFHDLHAERLEIRCDDRNERSAGVARRCGFAQEGHLHHCQRDTSGGLANLLIFGLLRATYFDRFPA